MPWLPRLDLSRWISRSPRPVRSLYPQVTTLTVNNQDDLLTRYQSINFSVETSAMRNTMWLIITTRDRNGSRSEIELRLDNGDSLRLAQMLHGMAAYQINRSN